MNISRRLLGFSMMSAVLSVTSGWADTTKPQPSAADQTAIQKAVDGGVTFLKNAQAQEGSWTAATSPGRLRCAAACGEPQHERIADVKNSRKLAPLLIIWLYAIALW